MIWTAPFQLSVVLVICTMSIVSTPTPEPQLYGGYGLGGGTLGTSLLGGGSGLGGYGGGTLGGLGGFSGYGGGGLLSGYGRGGYGSGLYPGLGSGSFGNSIGLWSDANSNRLASTSLSTISPFLILCASTAILILLS